MGGVPGGVLLVALVGSISLQTVGFELLSAVGWDVDGGGSGQLFSDIVVQLGIHDSDVNWFEAAQLLLSALVVPVLAVTVFVLLLTAGRRPAGAPVQ